MSSLLHVYNGIRGNQNRKYKNLYTAGVYLTYQYNESLKIDTTLQSISSIIGCSVYEIHEFDRIRDADKYYKATNQHHKYYEWKRMNMRLCYPFVYLQLIIYWSVLVRMYQNNMKEYTT